MEEHSQDKEDHQRVRALISKMLHHVDEELRQCREKSTIQECDGQDEDKGVVSPISFDVESSKWFRTIESNRDGGYICSR